MLYVLGEIAPQIKRKRLNGNNIILCLNTTFFSVRRQRINVIYITESAK